VGFRRVIRTVGQRTAGFTLQKRSQSRKAPKVSSRPAAFTFLQRERCGPLTDS